MKMKFDDAVNLIRQAEIADLILTPAKNGGYVCPMCGNGSGDDATGIDIKAVEGNIVGYCFKCGESFDTFKLLGLHFNLNPKTNFKELVQKSAELLGIEIEGKNYSKNHEEKNSAKDKKSMNEEIPRREGKYSNTIKAAQNQVKSFVEEQGGSWRGLTLETLNKFRCGFLPCVGEMRLPYVIIPTISDNHYLKRVTLSAEEIQKRNLPKKAVKPHLGSKEVFNLEDLQKAKAEDVFFVVEGEIDAMSICQAGFNAIAFGQTNPTELQRFQLEKISEKPRLIVMLDDDDAGMLNAEKTAKKLQKLGFIVEIKFLKLTTKNPETFEVLRMKDANEALQLEPEKLSARLQELIDSTAKNFSDKEDRKNFEEEAAYSIANNLTSKQIFPKCPVDVYIPQGYFVSDKGISKVTRTGPDEPFCGFPVFVSKIFYTTEREESQVEIVYFDARTDAWYKKTCKAGAIKDYRQILRMDELIIDSAGAARLSTFLTKMISDKRNCGKIKEKKFYTKTGWLQDDCKEFVFPTKLDGDYPVIGGFDFAEAFKKNGKIEDSEKLLTEMIFLNTPARLTLGTVLEAPLVKPLGLRNTQLHLYAKSGTGKSAITKAAISIFGNPSRLRETFGSTQKYLNDLPAKFDDLPVWVDELQSVDRSHRLKLDEFIYNYENGVTRGRLDKDAKEKPRKTFSGTRLTTGEQPITSSSSGQGAKNRVIEINVTGLIENKRAKEIHKMFSTKTRASYGHFGKRYIEYISQSDVQQYLEKYYDDTVDEIRLRAARQNGFKGNSQNIPDELVGLIPAHVQMFAGQLTGLHAFENIIFADKKNLREKAFQRRNEDIDYIIKNFSQSRLTSNGDRALNDLVDFIMSEDKGFRHQTADGLHILPQEVGVSSHGIKFIDGTVGISRSALKNFIRNYLDSSFHPDALIAEWSEMGVFKEGNSKTRLHQIFKTYSVEPGKEQGEYFYLVRNDVRRQVDDYKKYQLALLAEEAAS